MAVMAVLTAASVSAQTETTGRPADDLSDEFIRQLSGERRVYRPTASDPNAASRSSTVSEHPIGPRRLYITLNEGQLAVQGEPGSSDSLMVESTGRAERWTSGSQSSGTVALTRAAVAAGGSSPTGQTVSLARLDQLLGQNGVRGSALITPQPGETLTDGRLIVRRTSTDGSPLDPIELTVRSGGQTVAVVSMAAGQERVDWTDVVRASTDLSSDPADLANGLPPGVYAIGGPEVALQEFTVADSTIVDVLDGAVSRSLVPLQVEQWLVTDEIDHTPPQVSDALRLLETAEPTPYTERRKHELLASLGVMSVPPATTGFSSTALPPIDAIREQIAAGKDAQAIAAAKAIIEAESESSGGSRLKTLAMLYRAVAEAKSVQSLVINTRSIETERLFDAVDQASDELRPDDRFRIAMNIGNYRLGQAESRVANLAIQSAASIRSPLLSALDAWRKADEQYARAETVADQMPDSDRFVLALNRARSRVVIGDLLRMLSVDDNSHDALKNAADGEAQKFATAAAAAQAVDTRAAANEVLAHLAYRSGRFDDADAKARLAETDYINIGQLGGLAGVRRTLGLIAVRQGRSDEAIAQLQSSLEIAEFLRRQVSSADGGLRQSGFFARHAYTADKLIELLINRGDAREALRVVERSKATAFADLLAAELSGRRQDESLEQFDSTAELATLDDVLDDWSQQSVGLEYYLGADGVFAFLIRSDGRIEAMQLHDAAGQPLQTASLVRRVVDYLSETEATAGKMLARFRSGRNNLDNSWQDTLHRFYQELIPDDWSEDVLAARQLVVVPHHVLHYFPFAALVTERDDVEQGYRETVLPTFLVESAGAIVMAPSLRSYGSLTEYPVEVDAAQAVGLAKFESAPELPGVVTDLQNFRAVFGPDGADVLTAIVQTPLVSERQTLDQLAQPGLVLLATHGANVPDDPFRSHLLWSRTGDEDGELDLRELMSASIGCDIVVMSACYTGLADRSPLPGDDLFGLQRGLLQSGASSVVCGLWDVFDKTAPGLIRAMFERFAQGEPIAAALTQTQAAFVANAKAAGPRNGWFVHPYFWAVYTCTGGGHATLYRK